MTELRPLWIREIGKFLDITQIIIYYLHSSVQASIARMLPKC